ncbi:putative ferric-chelate reductase 1 [Pomacea canaliculata]|uniref:putative ferric-chelate reductase 1 n=1 Tax=Pomacea canaliculata TaxID=400727 RepID=UPI000D73E96A|nr:putative ferric-chelate reductase 1 [Pomacea canaliculata]XP_025109766.1 putative ferric-chelate reductase 1 [Pomacea canaliculata]XP_025109767.1 putative ferric-chelate reductase 1 [Pomacea canaliculata]XP_025109768.1 putative ferric-chelate reductase 1 [Pomacea canaliculata]
MVTMTKLLFFMLELWSVTVVWGAVDPYRTHCCLCNNLMPSDTPPNSKPQIMPSPFKIKVSSDTYTLDQELTVELVAEGEATFRDFMLVAWPTDNRPRTSLGTFTLLGKEYSPKQNCYNNERQTYAIQTADRIPKKYLRFTWETNRFEGHIEFRATFIVDDETYWVAESSPLVVDPSPNAPPLPRTPGPKITPYINVDECGLQKGCYREPAGCLEPYCEYIVTWQGTTDKVRFELSGLTDSGQDRYIAVALSNDTYMGEDIVFACTHDSSDDSTRVYISYNDHNRNINLDKDNANIRKQVITNEEGSNHNGRVRCRFTVDREIDYYYPQLTHIGGQHYHLLLARGEAIRGTMKRHGLGVNEIPVSSPGKIDFFSVDNINGRARYPLVKAHGCLMILAWVFFASIGLLMTKYYKPMWPNKRMFDHRYWFVAHTNCMSSMFIITIIGIILIFVEAGGWSVAPDLPQRAHPILGIIILVCIIINPIIALIRPSEEHKCRPVFNWFHWAFGTIANVLAIPQIFIGMDFGKANVPWWATWILVIWVIVHIVIELSLEVHQCCTYKKNKERRRKYELQKRENPKMHIDEPEPAGRRFKRFMLFFHLTVTTIVTIIMIIVIAVA